MKADHTNFITLLRHGKEEGILFVIETYGGYLRTIVRRRLFALPDLVDDCLNDIFFGIWKNIGSYDDTKGSFQNWAAAVARLTAIDYLRRAAREQRALSLEALELDLAQEDAGIAALAEQELSDEMQELLSCLNEKDKELFLRIYGQEEDPDTVGAGLGLSKNSVYVRLFRGKKKMRAFAANRKGM